MRAQLVNALRTADTRLQRADPEYATRAGSNGAHFLLPRPRTDVTPQEYAQLTINRGAEISAVGVYAWYHVSALQKASRLAREQLERNPSDAELWARLAEWLVNLEDHANARASVEEALRRGPENAVCLTCAARVQLQWNDRDGALDLLQRAIRAGCGPETLRRGLEFRVLSGDPRFQELLSGGPRSSEMRSEPEVEGGS